VQLKLPWQSLRPQPHGVSIAGAVAGETLPVEDAARGAELLESSQVESPELGDLAKLPPFRPVVITLLRLFDRPEVSLKQVCALVESDPAMASELLAIVNSPLFPICQPVSRPSHAITLLGTERTKSLAATLAMRSLMAGAPRIPIVRRFWMHSVATATIARRLAPSFQLEPELAHVCGLLHDLGRHGLLAAYPEQYSRLACAAFESSEAIAAAEQAELGMSHCEAGMRLAIAWRLPATIREVAGHHQDKSSDVPLVALVQLCCSLADDFMYQAIHRADIRKPEATIEQHVPDSLAPRLTGQLGALRAAIDTAIRALDF
jgi:putative nucleotidyltransferase with HDIG domain